MNETKNYLVELIMKRFKDYFEDIVAEEKDWDYKLVTTEEVEEEQRKCELLLDIFLDDFDYTKLSDSDKNMIIGELKEECSHLYGILADQEDDEEMELFKYDDYGEKKHE